MEGHVSFPGFSTNHNKVEQTEGQEIVYKQVTEISCQTYSKTSYLTKKDYFFIILKEGSRENYSASLTWAADTVQIVQMERGAFTIQVMVGKKLNEYCITFIYKLLFRCSSKSAKNSSEGNISLLPEHEKNLNFFGVCLIESSYVQKK